MRGQNFLPATASPADSARSVLIFRGNLETDQHLYLAFSFHRDYFARSDASLSCFFASQGLFRPDRMHPYLTLLFHRDYFHRSDASLSGSFSPQGLFRPAGCISILLFCSTGIISAGQLHLYLALLLHRDYFDRSDASLSGSFAPQGLFRPAGCISILLFCSTGIIPPRSDASLSGSFAPQGLFRPAGCISILLFFTTGIISTGQMHLYLAFLLHKDYFHRSDASLSCSFVPQGLFRPARLRYCRNSSYSFSCFISIFPRHRSGTLPWKIRFLFPACLLDRPFKIFLCDKIRKTNDRYPPEVFFVCIVKF